MNERIKQLAERCWDERLDGMHFDQEKFAELIIQECCQAFWTDECHTSDLAYLDYKEKTTKLKRHFGVEE